MKKKSIVFAVLLMSAAFVKAQCIQHINKSQLETGMFITGLMGIKDAGPYTAEINYVEGTGFICRFLHSNSAYEFIDLKHAPGDDKQMMQATVKMNAGGKYPANTVFKFYPVVAMPGGCDLNTNDDFAAESAIITFPDGKSYPASVSQKNKIYTAVFWHSNSKYTFRKNWKVLTMKGGTYPAGTAVKAVYATNVDLP